MDPFWKDSTSFEHDDCGNDGILRISRFSSKISWKRLFHLTFYSLIDQTRESCKSISRNFFKRHWFFKVYCGQSYTFIKMCFACNDRIENPSQSKSQFSFTKKLQMNMRVMEFFGNVVKVDWSHEKKWFH